MAVSVVTVYCVRSGKKGGSEIWELPEQTKQGPILLLQAETLASGLLSLFCVPLSCGVGVPQPFFQE